MLSALANSSKRRQRGQLLAYASADKANNGRVTAAPTPADLHLLLQLLVFVCTVGTLLFLNSATVQAQKSPPTNNARVDNTNRPRNSNTSTSRCALAVGAIAACCCVFVLLFLLFVAVNKWWVWRFPAAVSVVLAS